MPLFVPRCPSLHAEMGIYLLLLSSARYFFISAMSLGVFFPATIQVLLKQRALCNQNVN